MITVKDTCENLVVPNELIEIQKELMCTVIQHQDMLLLTPDPILGQGSIKHLPIQKGILALYFDLHLEHDTILDLNNMSKDLIQFFYSMEGSVMHKFNGQDQTATIEEFHSAIAHAQPGDFSRIKVEANKPFTLSMIIVDREKVMEHFDAQNPISQNLSQLISKVDEIPTHFHLSGYDIKIGDQLKLIQKNEMKTGISEMFAQRGRYYLVLAKHLEHFFIKKEMSENDSGLLKRELKKIAEVGDLIKAQPELKHTIQKFSRSSGLSPAKLQQGFKFIYNHTVSDYVRHIRLEKAENLLITTDLSISEVVYTVGLTSRSYFCKIFKRTYGCSPKEYKNKVLNVA